MSKFEKVSRWIFGLALQAPVYYVACRYFESKGATDIEQIGLAVAVALAFSMGQDIRRNEL